MKTSNLIHITGPTSLGKTSVSKAILKEFKGQLINSDKFHLFKYCEIGIGLKDSDYESFEDKYLYQILDPKEDVLSEEEYFNSLLRTLDKLCDDTLSIIEGCSFSYNRRIINSANYLLSFCLVWDDDENFTKRVTQRVERIFDLGLVNETEKLLEKGYSESYVMIKGVLYRTVLDYINGLINIGTAKKLIVSDFVKHAKYQKKRYLQLKNLNFIDGLQSTEQIIEKILISCRRL